MRFLALVFVSPGLLNVGEYNIASSGFFSFFPLSCFAFMRCGERIVLILEKVFGVLLSFEPGLVLCFFVLFYIAWHGRTLSLITIFPTLFFGIGLTDKKFSFSWDGTFLFLFMERGMRRE